MIDSDIFLEMWTNQIASGKTCQRNATDKYSSDNEPKTEINIRKLKPVSSSCSIW
jgi:DNA helicase-2/ATP-dependent DNA helicase PcrA